MAMRSCGWLLRQFHERFEREQPVPSTSAPRSTWLPHKTVAMGGDPVVVGRDEAAFQHVHQQHLKVAMPTSPAT